ncbi:MAG: hypothetical protein K2X47_16545, partial [Bdellovibrionales bacterium]|nr:hypothetical protein [Bdellovibrionales bacterium]
MIGVKVDATRTVEWCQNPTVTSDSESIVNVRLTRFSDKGLLSFAHPKQYLYAEGSATFVLQGQNNEACITELINLDPSGKPIPPTDARYLNVKSMPLKWAFLPKHVGLRNKAMTNLARFLSDIHSGVSPEGNRRAQYLDTSWNPGCSAEK